MKNERPNNYPILRTINSTLRVGEHGGDCQIIGNIMTEEQITACYQCGDNRTDFGLALISILSMMTAHGRRKGDALTILTTEVSQADNTLIVKISDYGEGIKEGTKLPRHPNSDLAIAIDKICGLDGCIILENRMGKSGKVLGTTCAIEIPVIN